MFYSNIELNHFFLFQHSLSKTPRAGKKLTIESAGRLYYIEGVVVTLACKSGYSLSSSPQVTCGAEGAWVPPIASCVDSKGIL